MKTEKEIREKIDELFRENERLKDRDWVRDNLSAFSQRDEWLEANCNIIDTLRWVIGDESDGEI